MFALVLIVMIVAWLVRMYELGEGIWKVSMTFDLRIDSINHQMIHFSCALSLIVSPLTEKKSARSC